MNITELELNNFRIYKGTNKIDLTTYDENKIVIVSGKNGFGKTTFLMSLVWCLYGRQMEDVDDLYKKEISDQGGYNKYIGNSLNRSAKSEGETKFSVSITFSDISIPELPCKTIKITRTYKTVGAESENVDILIDGYESELTNEIGSELFIRDFIMPLAIAKFFFFDAEKIVSLAEVNTADQRRNLSKAYSEVLGIQKYEDLKSELENLQRKLRADTASKTEKHKYETLVLDVQHYEDQIVEKEKSIENSKEEIDIKNREANLIQEKLIRSGSSITVEELERLREEGRVNSLRLDELNSELKSSYEIIPFAIAGDRMLDVFNQLDDEYELRNTQFNQEKIRSVTDNLINDLISQPQPEDLVIDYKVQDYYKGTISKLIKKHFFSDAKELPAEFQELHDFSDTKKNEFSALVNNIKSSFKESFKRISSDYNQTKNDLNRINKSIKDAEMKADDPLIEDDRRKKAELEKEILKTQNSIDSLNREIGELKNSIVQNNKEIDKITEKLKVSEQNKEKYETSERLIKELQIFITDFKEAKKKSLEKEIHNGLNTLMHKKNFVRKVEVQIIGEDIDINLFDKRKQEIRKDSLSKGEQQMYATALLKGLVEESDINFPVFIDSPMQKFDVDHAMNIVKYFYPNISEQVIIFPLVKKEMTLEEYDILKPQVSKCYLINNVDNDSSEFLEVEKEKLFEEFERLNAHAV